MIDQNPRAGPDLHTLWQGLVRAGRDAVPVPQHGHGPTAMLAGGRLLADSGSRVDGAHDVDGGWGVEHEDTPEIIYGISVRRRSIAFRDAIGRVDMRWQEKLMNCEPFRANMSGSVPRLERAQRASRMRRRRKSGDAWEARCVGPGTGPCAGKRPRTRNPCQRRETSRQRALS